VTRSSSTQDDVNFRDCFCCSGKENDILIRKNNDAEAGAAVADDKKHHHRLSSSASANGEDSHQTPHNWAPKFHQKPFDFII
jgi:hypothetical protein